jgi:hypothetical protein
MTMVTPTVAEEAAKFWAEDLEVVENRYLHTRSIYSLPASKSDGRVPSQGTVLLNATVNIDDIVGKPTRLERLVATLTRPWHIRLR